MYDDHKVVVWCPFGRERTVSLLIPYWHRDYQKGLIDEAWLFMNTGPGQEKDEAYAHELAKRYDWIKIVEKPGPDSPSHWAIPPSWREGYRDPIQRNTGRAYFLMQDPKTVYIRFDDDIVWVHRDAIEALVHSKLHSLDKTVAIFPIIINNAVSSWFLQREKKIPMEWGEVGRSAGGNGQFVSAVDPIGWGDPYFAEKLHTYALDWMEGDGGDHFMCDTDFILGRNQQFSVSCFAAHGSEYKSVNGILNADANYDEEEHWLTMHRCNQVGRDNIVHGRAVVSHFSFMTQREYLLQNTSCLQRYRKLSQAVEASL